MRAERSGKSALVLVFVVFVAVPMVYLLSVPLVKFAALKPEWVTLPLGDTGKTQSAWMYRRGVNRGRASNLAMSPPDWLNAYAAPYDWLMLKPGVGRPLYSYHNWWWNLLAR
jgi:hypothetical protein